MFFFLSGTVWIKCGYRQEQGIDVDPFDTVDRLKSKIKDEMHVAAPKYRIILKHNYLKLNPRQLLQGTDVVDMDTIFMSISPREFLMDLTRRTK